MLDVVGLAVLFDGRTAFEFLHVETFAQHGDADATPRDADSHAIRAGLAAHWPALAALPVRQGVASSARRWAMTISRLTPRLVASSCTATMTRIPDRKSVV